MASPLQTGTQSGSAFSSRNLDVLFEKIRITPDAAFETAQYEIEYTVLANQSGILVPLAFYAMDYEGDFEIWKDGEPVPFRTVSPNGGFGEGSPLADFGQYFDRDSVITLDWKDYQSELTRPEDLLYFEIRLDSGTSVIKVKYTAHAWDYRGEWLRELSFRYSLTPAHYWRSFGAIEVKLDATGLDFPVSTNLGNPDFGRLDSVAVWMLGNIPVETIMVNREAKLEGGAATLVGIGPFGLMLIFSAILIVIHLMLIFWHRKRKPTMKLSWIAVAGGVIFPFIMLMSYLWALDVIDSAIGEMASHWHGYSFLIMIFYVVVMPVYLGAVVILDVVLRKRNLKRAAG